MDQHRRREALLADGYGDTVQSSCRVILPKLRRENIGLTDDKETRSSEGGGVVRRQ